MKAEALLVSVCVLFGTLGFFGFKHVSTLEARLDEAYDKILELKENLYTTKDNLRKLQVKLLEAENSLSSVRSELRRLRSGSRYAPT